MTTVVRRYRCDLCSTVYVMELQADWCESMCEAQEIIRMGGEPDWGKFPSSVPREAVVYPKGKRKAALLARTRKAFASCDTLPKGQEVKDDAKP